MNSRGISMTKKSAQGSEAGKASRGWISNLGGSGGKGDDVKIARSAPELSAG